MAGGYKIYFQGDEEAECDAGNLGIFDQTFPCAGTGDYVLEERETGNKWHLCEIHKHMAKEKLSGPA